MIGAGVMPSVSSSQMVAVEGTQAVMAVRLKPRVCGAAIAAAPCNAAKRLRDWAGRLHTLARLALFCSSIHSLEGGARVLKLALAVLGGRWQETDADTCLVHKPGPSERGPTCTICVPRVPY